MSDPTVADRFWAKVDRRGPDECWPWLASRSGQGYGFFWNVEERFMESAHRVALRLSGADVPRGQVGARGVVVRHRCDNPPCCNPAHLAAGSQGENMAEMSARGRAADNTRERNPKAKLTAALVAEIRENFTGRYGEKMAIARRYGISSGHVSKIIAGDVW